VLTFNVNYGMAGDEATLSPITSSDADVVFLQETNPAWRRFAEPRLRERFPHQAWHTVSGAGGQAVLARRPVRVQKVLPSPAKWFFALLGVADTPLGPVQFLAVHLHPPVTEDGNWLRGYFSTDPVRKKEIEQFAAALEPQLPTIVVGDFIEGTSGSALPELLPSAKTWRWQWGRVNLSAQLDHIVYDRWFEPLTAQVIVAGNSDHLPVRVMLARAAQPAQNLPLPHGSSLSLSLSR
jgi:endonuclease/exonuclease/phosphatase family metal-dependent hydrolase